MTFFRLAPSILFLILCQTVHAQEWQFYDQENSALPHSGIRQILVDSDNNKWLQIGADSISYGHVLKIDNSSEWTFYNWNNSPLPQSRISCIMLDDFDRIWVANDNGEVHILHSDEEWSQLEWPADSPWQSPIMMMAYTEEEDLLWFCGSESGLMRMDIDQQELTDLSFPFPGILFDQITSMIEDGYGNILAHSVTSTILGIYNDLDGWSASSISMGAVASHMSQSEDKIWIPGTGILHSLNTTSNEHVIDTINTSMSLRFGMEDQQDNIWIALGNSKLDPGFSPGYLAGLIRQDPEGEVVNLNEFIGSPLIYTIVEDHEGSIWIGTTEGLSIYGPISSTSNETATANEVQSALQLFPNPSAGDLHLKLPSGIAEQVSICIYNTQGKLQKKFDYPHLSDAQSPLMLRIDDLAEGTYYLLLRVSDQRWNSRFVVCH